MYNSLTQRQIPPKLLVELATEETAGRITVKLEPFLQLTDEMTIAIEALVRRWEATAAPAAQHRALRHERQELAGD